jgi:lysophospholipase L1-like esterase
MNKLKIALFFALIFATISLGPAQTYDRAKIWDKEIDALTEIDSRQTPPEKAVLFVGSSSIRGWRSLRQNFPGLKFINRGFGGSRLEDTNYYFDRIVAPYNPRIIVLYAGENDVNDGIAPEKVADDYKKFANLVRQKLPKTRIIYISLKPSPSRWKLADKFRQTNALIKAEVARDKRAVFIDVWLAMLNEKGEPRPELFLGDMLHMKENGYEIWRGLLEKHLK